MRESERIIVTKIFHDDKVSSEATLEEDNENFTLRYTTSELIITREVEE